MKKEYAVDKFDLEEKILGGIFGVISIVATIVELYANGFSTATVFGAVKDVFGTLVVVVLFVAVMKALKPPKAKNFRDLLNASMEKVERNYAPLIRKAITKETDTEAKTKKLENTIRYEIGSNINVFLKASVQAILDYLILMLTRLTKLLFQSEKHFSEIKRTLPLMPKELFIKFPAAYKKDSRIMI